MACGAGDGARAWQGLGWLAGWSKGMAGGTCEAWLVRGAEALGWL